MKAILVLIFALTGSLALAYSVPFTLKNCNGNWIEKQLNQLKFGKAKYIKKCLGQNHDHDYCEWDYDSALEVITSQRNETQDLIRKSEWDKAVVTARQDSTARNGLTVDVVTLKPFNSYQTNQLHYKASVDWGNSIESRACPGTDQYDSCDIMDSRYIVMEIHFNYSDGDHQKSPIVVVNRTNDSRKSAIFECSIAYN